MLLYSKSKFLTDDPELHGWLIDNGFRIDPPVSAMGHSYIYARDAVHEMLLTLRWR